MENDELLVTITFRVPHTDPNTVAGQVVPVMRTAMKVGGDTARIDISVYEPAETGLERR